MNMKDCKIRRRLRVRHALSKGERLRLTVHRTKQNIYVQLVDDLRHVTVCSSSSIASDFKKKMDQKSESNADQKDRKKPLTKTIVSKKVGEDIAKKTLALGCKDVLFDRGSCVYHGRVKALADGARAHGLNF